MAKQQQLQAQTRSAVGRNAVKKMKETGLVPAVIYGAGQETQPLAINAREINNLLARAVSEHVLVDLEINGGEQVQKRLALIQEVQHHPLRRNILHVDFHAVREDEKIHAEIPVETLGEPAGVKNFGGVLEHSLHTIEVECLPRDLPESIAIDVSALNVGDAIHVKDVNLPEGVAATAAPDLTVVRVAAPKVEVEAAGAVEAAAQPEVLKEKKDDAAAAKTPEKK